MRAVIFAGGVGTRMWPLSRKKSPKQFEKIVGDQSTLQLAIGRLRPEFNWSDIYISTGEQYVSLIQSQIPQLPKENIIAEPEMRDVAPAVGYVASILAKHHPEEPFAILWSDHLINKIDVFKSILRIGADYIREHPHKILFIGQKSRFPNQNLGWIQQGKQITSIDGFHLHKFKSWHYRPNIQLARKYYNNANYSWNPGYFIATPGFIMEQYRRFMPDMHKQLKTLQDSWGETNHSQHLKTIYPNLEKISFDNAILERLEPQKAAVLTTDMGWSDIGAWEALKEALQKTKNENITHGKVYAHDSRDSLIYNYTNKLVTTIDLDGMLVIVTEDVILVCPQESVPEIKKVVNSFETTNNEKYT